MPVDFAQHGDCACKCTVMVENFIHHDVITIRAKIPSDYFVQFFFPAWFNSKPPSEPKQKE